MAMHSLFGSLSTCFATSGVQRHFMGHLSRFDNGCCHIGLALALAVVLGSHGAARVVFAFFTARVDLIKIASC